VLRPFLLRNAQGQEIRSVLVHKVCAKRICKWIMWSRLLDQVEVAKSTVGCTTHITLCCVLCKRQALLSRFPVPFGCFQKMELFTGPSMVVMSDYGCNTAKNHCSRPSRASFIT